MDNWSDWLHKSGFRKLCVESIHKSNPLLGRRFLPAQCFRHCNSNMEYHLAIPTNSHQRISTSMNEIIDVDLVIIFLTWILQVYFDEVDQKIYVAGGANGASLFLVQIYHFSNHSWTVITAPYIMQGDGIVRIGNEILFLGGETTTGDKRRIQYYNLLNGTWTTTLTLLQQHINTGNAFVLGTTLYLLNSQNLQWAHCYAIDYCGSTTDCLTVGCNQTTGECTNEFTNNSCDDGNPCTIDDACQSGVCVSGPPKCNSTVNQCQSNICDDSDGSCSIINTDDIECDDMNSCSLGDVCAGGVCQSSNQTSPSCLPISEPFAGQPSTSEPLSSQPTTTNSSSKPVVSGTTSLNYFVLSTIIICWFVSTVLL